MKELVLTQAHLNELNAFIQELPVKYGVPLLNFLNRIAQEAEAAKTEEKAPEAAQ